MKAIKTFTIITRMELNTWPSFSFTSRFMSLILTSELENGITADVIGFSTPSVMSVSNFETAFDMSKPMISPSMSRLMNNQLQKDVILIFT